MTTHAVCRKLPVEILERLLQSWMKIIEAPVDGIFPTSFSISVDAAVGWTFGSRKGQQSLPDIDVGTTIVARLRSV